MAEKPFGVVWDGSDGQEAASPHEPDGFLFLFFFFFSFLSSCFPDRRKHPMSLTSHPNGHNEVTTRLSI